jgi:hypothetical protein
MDGSWGARDSFFEKGFRGGAATSSAFSCFELAALLSLSRWNMIHRPFPGTVFDDGAAKTTYHAAAAL